VRLATLALLCCAGPALAQSSSLSAADLSRGLTLPPTSVATVEDATALSINPAALSRAGGPQLFYGHEESGAKDTSADGLWAGASVADLLGVGATAQWVRSPSAPDARRVGLGLSFGGAGFSAGASWNQFRSPFSPELSGLQAWDLGLAARPLRQVALGAVLRNANAPARGDIQLQRELLAGVAVRPFGDRLTFAVDGAWRPGVPLSGAQLSYLLQGEPVQGLVLGAGLAHGLGGPVPLTAQLSATFQFGQLGAGYAAGVTDGKLSHTALARASLPAWPQLAEPGNRLAVLELRQLLSPRGSPLGAVLGERPADPWLTLHRTLAAAEQDPSVSGVVLKLDRLPGVGMAKAQELRAWVVRLRAAGKKVVAVLVSVADPEYLVASAADSVVAVPEAVLELNGFAANVTLLGGAMERLGVKWEVARVGEYKTAPEQLTRDSLSPAARETLDATLDVVSRAWTEQVAAGRRVPVARLAEAWAEGLVQPRRAKELGLVDALVDGPGLEAHLQGLLPGARPGWRPRAVRERRWGERPRVVVVPVVGSISGGRSRSDPLGLEQTAGADTVVRALDRAARDPGVAAIVLRVDSGGGDALASDLMYRAVLEARKRKPVVASMGDVAASGGYYAAMAADEVLASPTTVTGSIGIFLLKPALDGLAEKLGVRTESLQRGPQANLLSPWHAWTDAERTAAQRWVDGFYDDFITLVAEQRKLDKFAVDRVARGRVWAGETAKGHGLVDRMGGLWDAVTSARRRAGLPESEEVALEFAGESGGGLEGVLADAAAAAFGPELAGASAVARELGVSPEVLFSPGLKALSPVTRPLR
jgi:protease-4